MAPEELKAIRQTLALSCDGMAAVLRFDGKNGADKIRQFESGARKPSGPAMLIYETIGRGYLPNFWLDPVGG